MEVPNNFANGIELFTHADAGNLAPYIYLYKTRGAQVAPTAMTYAGYEIGSMGGLQFGGWDGSAYIAGGFRFTNDDEDLVRRPTTEDISIFMGPM